MRLRDGGNHCSVTNTPLLSCAEMAHIRQKRTVTLVGSGNLAYALAQVLPPAGHKVVEIVTRRKSSGAKELGLKAGVAATTAAQACWSGDIVWLAVSDGAIRELASS